MKRKGVKSTNFILALLIGLLVLAVLGKLSIDFIFQAGESVQGCSRLESIIADAIGGAPSC